jgi:hypothetical protein
MVAGLTSARIEALDVVPESVRGTCDWGYNRHYQASEARRSAKYIRTNHRLRWPSVFSGQRELLGADGTWVCGIGRLWGLTFEPQPAAPPACFVELHLEDGFPWYKDDSVLD